jgi:dipeptidyl aminopeptidase/acylaminoacyl peptidase
LDGSASHAAWDPDGSGLLYYHSSFTQPHRLRRWRDGRTTTLVDGLRGKLPAGELVDATLVRYASFDGRGIPAWLFEPTKDRSRHAAVVDPHGGPESQTVNEWRPRYQFMAAEGFTVLAPNYRGGTGYGRAWRRLSDRDLGGGDMQDILAGGRWLIRTRRCAPRRLGAVGVSYGGYAVAHVLEQAPDLWAVGVSIVGYFNWLTATTNERGYLRRYDRQKMGDPDTDADLYRKFSPIHYLDRIRAPVLFTGGAHDPRCPVTEARAIVEQMKNMGKTVEYLEFPDEGHSPRKMANQIALNERVLDWLNRYLPDA